VCVCDNDIHNPHVELEQEFKYLRNGIPCYKIS